MQTKSSLIVRDLTKSYGDFVAINKISFKVPSNGIFGLLGTNGAGKTTLIGMILGLIKPSSGSISIFEKPFEKNKSYILKRINFESPYVDLPKKLTVKQNLVFYSRLYGINNYLENIEFLSEGLKIEELLNKKFGTLSAGQKTKVGICKSLINSPKLLLLDEPTSSLDPETSIFIRNFLVKYQKKMKSSIIIASHNMIEVEKICERIILLKGGSIVVEGKVNDLLVKKKKRNLEQLFIEICG